MNVAPQVGFLHIRFEGQSYDTPLADLDVGVGSQDDQIKRSLANYLDIDRTRFRDYVIDRHSTGNLTIRPEAIFG